MWVVGLGKGWKHRPSKAVVPQNVPAGGPGRSRLLSPIGQTRGNKMNSESMPGPHDQGWVA